MAASGDPASTISGRKHEYGSDEVSGENQCDQCSESGLTVDATGFCTECKDFLCTTCINLHKTLRGLKTHIVLTGKDLPRTKPLDTVIEPCPKHPTEPVILYCVSENVFGCVCCFTTEHKACQDVGLVADLSTDVETSKEMKHIKALSMRHRDNIELYRKLIAEYHVINNNCYDMSMKDFEAFRSDIEAILDRLSEAVSTESKELKDTNKEKLDQLSKDVTTIDKDMVALMSDIEMKQKLKQKDQLFIAVMKNMKQFQDLMQTHTHLRKDIQINSYQFAVNPALKKVLNAMADSDNNMKILEGDITFAGELNIKTTDDKEDCGINGMVQISPSEMLITDIDNQCLKLVHVDRNTIVKKRALASAPRDLTTIPETRVAVALPLTKQIQFFSGDENLAPCGQVDLDGECLAVKSLEDKLVVSFRNPPKVQIMDLGGHVLRSFTSDAAGNQLFEYPRFMSVRTQEASTYLYVSDRKRGYVTCLATDGNVEWIYKDEDMKYPHGVATGTDGCIYICSPENHSIHIVSLGGAKLRMLQLARFVMVYPAAICLDWEKGVMYVSSSSADPKEANDIRRFALQ